MLEENILNKYRIVAIVGISPDEEKESYGVGYYLKKHGYRVIPVNPFAVQILGETSYPDLSSIPDKVEIVDIFRKSELVMPVVDEAIKIGASVIWMQERVVNDEAAQKAREAGLLVVMNKCIKRSHEILSLSRQKSDF